MCHQWEWEPITDSGFTGDGVACSRVYEGHSMKTRQKVPIDIDQYIAGFPEDVQEKLEKIRMTIKKAAPGAEETISYKMPTFNLKGKYLIYFAAYKKHIALYPAPIGKEEFKEDIAPYESGKGTLQFPLDKPIPFSLIRKIVKYRVKENLAIVAPKANR
jgi:uncharacterized protein YdhG (YjbR/CyaY superfamily)